MEDAVAFCAARPEILAAFLFGSAAAGRLRPESDVDLALLLDGSVPRPRYLAYRLDAAAALEPTLGRPVDVVILNEAPPLLRYEVLRRGRVLLSRDPARVRDERARAMLDWFDYEPVFRRITGAAIEGLRASVRG